MTTAIDNPVMCTRCGYICAAAAVPENCIHWGWTDNPANSTENMYEDECPRCPARDSFRAAIICAVCDDFPCQCTESDDG